MLFENLSENDKNLIYNFIQQYGPIPGSRIYNKTASLEHLLRFWNADKEWLYELMGGNFILEKQITYTKSASKMRDEISTAMTYHGPMGRFKREYFYHMGNHFSNCNYRTWDIIEHLISPKALSENSLMGCPYKACLPLTLEFDNGKKIRIEETTKPMRALGKIAKFIGQEENFETFRIEHSRILNQKSIEGTLCLSIHPMDYLTMSDNESNWSSCMSWVHYGGYRMGTVEMMNSSWVIVAYLKHSNENTKLDWNNKYWRSLFIAHPSVITSIKGYPYNCDNLAQECVNWIRELFIQNKNAHFTEPFKIEPETSCQAPNDHYYRLELETNVMYPDYESMEYLWGAVPVESPHDESSKDDPFHMTLNYSGVTECMCCGSDMWGDYAYEESYVYCEDCCSYADEEDERQCNHCGCWYDYDDLYFCEDEYYCCDCIDEVGARDVMSSDYYYYENLIKVYLAREVNNPSDEDEYVYIHRHYDGNSGYRLTDWWKDEVIIPYPHLTENGLYYFNREDLTKRGYDRWFEMDETAINDYFNQN